MNSGPILFRVSHQQGPGSIERTRAIINVINYNCLSCNDMSNWAAVKRANPADSPGEKQTNRHKTNIISLAEVTI